VPDDIKREKRKSVFKLYDEAEAEDRRRFLKERLVNRAILMELKGDIT